MRNAPLPPTISISQQVGRTPGSGSVSVVRQMEFPPHGFPRHAHYRLCLRLASCGTIIPVMDQNDYTTFSFSGLSSMAECGHKFRLTRLDQVDEPMSFAASAGSAFHTAADLVDELLAQEQEPPF